MLGEPKKGKMIDPADKQLWEEIKRLPLPEHPVPLPLMRAWGQPLPEGTAKLDPRVTASWLGAPIIAIFCLLFFGVIGGLVSIIVCYCVIAFAKKEADRVSPLAELKARRLAVANEAQAKVDVCLDKLYLMAAEGTVKINLLKVKSDDYYKQLKDISLMPSPHEREQLVGKLKELHEKGLTIIRETKRDMLEMEEEHRKHRKVLMQAGADLQVVMLAQENRRDDPFFRGALVICIVVGVNIGLHLVLYSISTPPHQHDWSHPSTSAFDSSIDLPTSPTASPISEPYSAPERLV